MSRSFHRDTIALRYLIGFLGEAGQAGWWPSRFLSAASESFLKPVFAKTMSAAQYHGVRDAASLVHDERIGVGRVFHLFRLPEAMEQRLLSHLLDIGIPEDVSHALILSRSGDDKTAGVLQSAAELHQGPVQVGTTEDLQGHVWQSRVASAYHAAFQGDARSFPYLVERL